MAGLPWVALSEYGLGGGRLPYTAAGIADETVPCIRHLPRTAHGCRGVIDHSSVFDEPKVAISVLFFARPEPGKRIHHEVMYVVRPCGVARPRDVDDISAAPLLGDG